jgi:23S rRNA (adenine2503-C2)-methyltransferase
MRIKAKAGNEDIATVYIAETEKGKLIEFAESVEPPIPREKKWVLTLSTLYGCPVGCRFCDAGSFYQGKLSKADILSQIDYLIRSRFLDGSVPVEKFKVQFARVGEPSFNANVLDVLEELPALYDAPGLIPSISTIAPKGTDAFFARLLEIKNKLYRERFQLQFSIHTTDIEKRDWLIPVKKWDFARIADYGDAFYREGERKITLNFALAEGMSIDADVLLCYFTPDKFLLKVTPVNPTYQVRKHNLSSHIQPDRENYEIIEKLREAGYRVILSIGDWEENHIGSNCGQHITNYLRKKSPITNGYTYPLQET